MCEAFEGLSVVRAYGVEYGKGMHCSGFYVLTVLTIQRAISLDVTPYSLTEVYRSFGRPSASTYPITWSHISEDGTFLYCALFQYIPVY
jgi:hypothetical protein